jgi:uncharacterized membrane protein HdeD (DUF308 family)
MIRVLTKNWWIVVLRGVLAVLFGLLAFAWPGLTLVTLVLLFGAYALVDGIFAIVTAVTSWSERDDRWLLLLSGIAGIGIGIATFRTPDITALVLLMFIAAWALVTGVLQIAAAIRLRHEIEGELWLALSGILSIVVAFLLWLFPGAGALSVVWLIAAYAIVFGVVLIGLGLKLRGWGKRLSALRPSPA